MICAHGDGIPKAEDINPSNLNKIKRTTAIAIILNIIDIVIK